MDQPSSYVCICLEANLRRAFDKDFAMLALNIVPSVLAPGGHQGRQTVFREFQRYYAEDGHKTGSRLVRARYEVHCKWDVPARDIEHFDLSVCYGLLVNTVPTVSWVLYYIYSQPSLLKDLRMTVAPHIRTYKDYDGSCRYHVNIADIIASCSLLSSVIQETLRVHSTNASGRVILKDTLIEDRYLLKHDSMLLIPSVELHNNSSIWGTSPNIFNPRRFLQKERDGAKSSAYRAFGGGASVCPGRFLATNEIIIISVIMILRYELYPISGQWSKPKSLPHIQTSILTPTEDIHVGIAERKEFENTSWTFVWDAHSTGVQSSI